MGLSTKKEMLEPKSEELSLKKQCELLAVNRSSYYYNSKTYLERSDKELIEEIVKIYELLPFYGYRRIQVELKKKGFKAGKRRILRLKKELNLRTFYPEPKTTLPNRKDSKYPYLLKDLEITRQNQVWSTDITFIPVKTGFVYLVSIIDIYSRKILSSKVSTTMNKEFCIEALEEALERYGTPEIFNSDQGSQFTSNEFLKRLKDNDIKISMDGKGRALDNIYIERYWRTLKYEDIYLNNYETPKEVRQGITKFTHFYNSQRIHSSLEYKTPDEIYFNNTRCEKTNPVKEVASV